MAERGRPGMSAEIKAHVWERVKAGESFTAIGRAVRKSVGSIYNVVRTQGGIAPAVSHRAERAVTSAEREAISRGLAAGDSLRLIARQLGRAPSTISRKITRNAGPNRYRALEADARAWQKAKRPKVCRLAANPALCSVVETQLRANWSPEQVAWWLVRESSEDPTAHVSYETIYRTLFLQALGALKRELTAHLRPRRPLRRSKRATKTGQTRGQIVDAVSIAERPACIEGRAIPRHCEGDLLAGAKDTHIATLFERKSRYVLLIRVTGKDTTTVVTALIREVQRLPEGLMASLTWDHGMELAQHHRFTVATDVAVYFCDPHCPWQRDTNENTNRLLRQYFPDQGVEVLDRRWQGH